MREINLDNITGNDLIDYEGIARAFKKYLMDILEYDEDEADYIIKTDFSDPYDTPYILQDYEGIYTVDGKEYEVVSCHTDFCYVGMFEYAELEPFEFYMFFDKETLPDHMVISYRNARKMFII